MLANNVASVCTGINILIRTKLSCVSHVFLLPLVQSPSAFPASANVVPSLYEFLGGLLVARSAQRVLMGLTDRRKTAKNLADSRKN